jgi:hypothetical protein
MPMSASSALFVVWVGVLLWFAEQFVTHDFGAGRRRFALIVALGATALAIPGLLSWISRIDPPRGIGWVSAGLFIVFLAIGIHTTAESISLNRQAEMGQINYRAIELLRQGVNPYAPDTYLDFHRYDELLRRAETAGCITPTPEIAQRDFDRFWRTVDVADMRRLPTISTSAECAETRRDFQVIGLKYGPALIASYFPFVSAFGERGIYVSHVVFFIALVLALWLWGRRRLLLTRSLATIPLLFVVVPTLVRYDVLHDSDCDLAPTALAVWAWMLFDDKRDRAGGVVLALSVAAKFFPGLLVAPLLLGMRRPAWGYFAVTLAVAMVPFFLWEPEGFVRNLVLFNLVRDTDSTALAHYLPEWARSILAPLFVCVWAGVIAWAHAQRWSRPASLVCVICSHLALFATAKVFHNNYLVWLLPFLGLWVALQLRRRAVTPPHHVVASSRGTCVPTR